MTTNIEDVLTEEQLYGTETVKASQEILDNLANQQSEPVVPSRGSEPSLTNMWGDIYGSDVTGDTEVGLWGDWSEFEPVKGWSRGDLPPIKQLPVNVRASTVELVGNVRPPMTREEYTTSAQNLMAVAKASDRTVADILKEAWDLKAGEGTAASRIIARQNNPISSWSDLALATFIQSAKVYGMPISSKVAEPTADVQDKKAKPKIADLVKSAAPTSTYTSGRYANLSSLTANDSPIQVDARNTYATVQMGLGKAAPNDEEAGRLIAALAVAEVAAKQMQSYGYRGVTAEMLLDNTIVTQVNNLKVSDPDEYDVISGIASSMSGNINVNDIKDPGFMATFGANFRSNYPKAVAKEAVTRTFGSEFANTGAGMLFADIVISQGLFNNNAVVGGQVVAQMSLSDFAAGFDSAANDLVKTLAAVAYNGDRWAKYTVGGKTFAGASYKSQGAIAPGSKVPKVGDNETILGPVPDAKAVGYGVPEIEFVMRMDGKINGLLDYINNNLVQYSNVGITPENIMSLQTCIKDYVSERFTYTDQALQSASNYLLKADNTDAKLYRQYIEDGNQDAADRLMVAKARDWGGILPDVTDDEVLFYYTVAQDQLFEESKRLGIRQDIAWQGMQRGDSRVRRPSTDYGGGAAWAAGEAKATEDRAKTKAEKEKADAEAEAKAKSEAAWLENMRRNARAYISGVRYMPSKMR